MFFSMVFLGQQTKLAVLGHHALRATKRLFGIPDFWYYAIADGLRGILFAHQTRPFRFARKGRVGPSPNWTSSISQHRKNSGECPVPQPLTTHRPLRRSTPGLMDWSLRAWRIFAPSVIPSAPRRR